jgi:hypothetical protein
VPVEDHSLSAGDFEGIRAGQARGTGAVIIWDEGLAEVTRDEPGHLSAQLHGSKLTGGFALTRTAGNRWILIKTRDSHARPGSDIAAERPTSVRTGKSWQDLASEQLLGRRLQAQTLKSEAMGFLVQDAGTVWLVIRYHGSAAGYQAMDGSMMLAWFGRWIRSLQGSCCGVPVRAENTQNPTSVTPPRSRAWRW